MNIGTEILQKSKKIPLFSLEIILSKCSNQLAGDSYGNLFEHVNRILVRNKYHDRSL